MDPLSEHSFAGERGRIHLVQGSKVNAGTESVTGSGEHDSSYGVVMRCLSEAVDPGVDRV
jgi:hypothetical protein